MMMEKGENIEGDADIPYPLADLTQIDFWKIIGDSKLEEITLAEEIGKFQKLWENVSPYFYPILNVLL